MDRDMHPSDAGERWGERQGEAACLRFGAGSLGASGWLMEGWGSQEDGFVWAIGGRSSFAIQRPAGSGPLMLELDVNPFVPPGGVAGQRLVVLVEGRQVGQDWVRGEGTLGYPVPELGGSAQHATVSLHMPDACRPSDVGLGADRRQLGFMLRSACLRRALAAPAALQRRLPPLPLPAAHDAGTLAPALRGATGLAADELAAGFESLGHNCEFGMVQRHCGAEPLGLLRFAGITLPDLLTALQTDLLGVGEASQLEVLLAHGVRREFILRDMRHRISVHTRRFEGEADADTVGRKAGPHLRLLRRKLVEDLRSAGKIFVFQRPGQTLDAQAWPLLQRLRAYGSACLLFVTEDDAHPPGTVEELGYGYFRGFIDRVAPQEDVGRCNLAAWLSLCANTARLWQATGNRRQL